MNVIHEEARDIPIVDEADVLVVGGGPAGMVAAVAAARNGARTTLVERYGFLGGMATAALVGPLASVRHRYGGGRVVGGIGWEVIQRLARHDGALLDRIRYAEARSEMLTPASDSRADSVLCKGDVPFDPEVLKWVADQMTTEVGIRLRYHSLATGTLAADNKVAAVLVESKSGRQALSGTVVVDATGDADVAARSGVPFETGRPGDGALQPMSLMFRLGGVETDALGDIARPYIHPPIRKLAEEAVDRGDLPVFGGPWTFWGSTFRRGEVCVNMVRLWGDATEVETLSRNEVTGRDHVQRFVAFLRAKIPEFANCFLIDSGTQIGVRETRRIQGDYQLTADDVRSGRRFDDAIGLAGHIIDIHSPAGAYSQVREKVAPYQIPYRCLLPVGMSNLLVAGRSISATHEAHASLRVMGTGFVTGQAAGTAAALAAAQGGDIRDVDAATLRDTLLEQGAILDRGLIE
jgi:hypothetical protein